MSSNSLTPPEFVERIAGLDPADFTSATIVDRGVRYQRSGQVGTLIVRPRELTARVTGSRDEPYKVYFLEDQRGLIALCDCPFDREPFCKHMAATVMACRAAIEAGRGWAVEKEQCPEDRIERTLSGLRSRRSLQDPFKALELDCYLLLHDLGRCDMPVERRLDVGVEALEQTLDVLLFNEPPSAWPLEFLHCLIRWALRETEDTDPSMRVLFSRLLGMGDRIAAELVPAVMGACQTPRHRRRVASCLRCSFEESVDASRFQRSLVSNLIDRLAGL